MKPQSDENAIVHVVDDDASMREAVQSLCHSIGIEARTYATARDFLTTAVSDAPGCIVIAIRLPDMNAVDLQAELTQTGVRLPVVVLTVFDNISMSVRARKSGAVAFITKPFNDQVILDAVLAAIQRDKSEK